MTQLVQIQINSNNPNDSNDLTYSNGSNGLDDQENWGSTSIIVLVCSQKGWSGMSN